MEQKYFRDNKRIFQVLVNKFHYLDNTYNSDEMKKISNVYSYGDNQKVTEDTFNAFLDMWNAAKKENLTLIINSSFRSYEDQDEIYKTYYNLYGESYVKKYTAKPGFSEHQTGLSLDIASAKSDIFENSKEFKWMKENAYKYGYILRFPKTKAEITGFRYEAWHYRYVGKDIAKYMYENNLTFDEYYAIFLDK